MTLLHEKIKNKNSGQSYNTIKDPQWCAVQGSDTTMMTNAPSARTINYITKTQTTT